MPPTEWVPIFNGKAQGSRPRNTRARSQAVKRCAQRLGNKAANSGTPGLKWSYTLSTSSGPARTSFTTRCKRVDRLFKSATRMMSSNAIHKATQRAISRVTAHPCRALASLAASACQTWRMRRKYTWP